MATLSTEPEALSAGNTSRARRDALKLVICTALLVFVCVYVDVNESLFDWTRHFENLQLDEAPIVLFALSYGLAWFAMRRYREARNEVASRKRTESRLVKVLEENRRLAREYLRVQESERKVLAHELHDELGQYLNAIKTDSTLIQRRIGDVGGDLARAVNALGEHADHVQFVVRHMIRQLRPTGLDELGLAAALEHYLNYWQRQLPHIDLDTSIESALDILDEELSLAVYRLTQEALANVSKHANASRVEIRIERVRDAATRVDEIRVRVTDNGQGLALSNMRMGLGLTGIRDRVEMFGGTLALKSAPGSGFEMSAHFPALYVAHAKAS